MSHKSLLSKVLKTVSFFFASFIILFLILLFGAQRRIENNLVNVLNKDPNRVYNISYDELDLSPLLKGFKLKNAQISPRVSTDSTFVICNIETININNFVWNDLLFHHKLELSEMSFIRPKFVLTIGLQKAKQDSENQDGDASNKVQGLFGDILSRAKLKNFTLLEGSFSIVKNKPKPIEIARIGNLNLEARNIETDSTQLKNPIPFKVGDLSSSIEDIMFLLSEHSVLECGSIKLNKKLAILSISDFSIKLNKNWIQISEKLGEQIDLFEVELKSLTINKLENKSQLYGDLDIRAESIVIDHLNLMDHKNKNLPRLKEEVQAMFSGMVASIPFDLRVDTIKLKNTFISYAELGKGKSTPGVFTFDNLNGSIYNFTTVQSYQDLYKKFELNVVGKLNNAGKLTVKITVPYAVDEFFMTGKIENLDVRALNSTIQPLAGIEANSGNIHLLKVDMHATTASSKNMLVINYDSLKISVLNLDEEEVKKKGVVSLAANSLMRKQNMPGDKNYLEAEYETVRNIRRAPFNLMFSAIQEGLVQILPTKTAKQLLEQTKKKKEKQSKKDK